VAVAAGLSFLVTAKSGLLKYFLLIPFIEIGKFIPISPLTQFAPVFHGNHPARAASQWAKPHRQKYAIIYFVSIHSKGY
jgi:hypothetical protein